MVAHIQIHKHRPKTTIKCACEPQKPANIPLILWIKMDELLPFANQFIAKAIEHNGKWWLQFSDTVRSLIHSTTAGCYAEYQPKNGINWIWYYSSSSSSESEMFLCFNNKSTEICCMFYVMRSDSSKLNLIQSEKQTHREKKFVRTPYHATLTEWYMDYGGWNEIYITLLFLSILIECELEFTFTTIKIIDNFKLYACIDNKNQRLLWLILLVYCTANLFGAEKTKQANNLIPIQ